MPLTPQNIINSQAQFWSKIDIYILNELLQLFDNSQLTKYIDEERKLRGLDISGTIIVSSIEGFQKLKNDDIYLFLIIKKNNKDIVHITFHLVPKSMNPKLAGPIHFKKNIYNIGVKSNIPHIYSRIYVEIPKNKPDSLTFSMEPGYDTTVFATYDTELTKEIDVIIDVINKFFDEHNETYYIGNKKEVTNIHKYTNNAAKKMNTSKLVTRKNHGVFLITFNTSNIQKRVLSRIKKTLKSTKHKRNTNISFISDKHGDNNMMSIHSKSNKRKFKSIKKTLKSNKKNKPKNKKD